MARRSPDDYSNSSDDRSRDLAAQFWGSSPSWRTTGTYRGSRRNGDRTGPVARTRRHGDRTGQIPIVDASAADEPLIDPYDFGFDDVGYGPDQGIAGKRFDNRDRTSPSAPFADQPEPVEQIELDVDGGGRSRDAVSGLAERLGLGAVDPLLLRLGVIVMIGVLLVPLAMSFRPDSNQGSVRTEVTSGPSVELPEPTESAVGVDAPAVDAAGSAVDASPAADPSPTEQSSDGTPAAPTTSPPVAAIVTEQSETTTDVGDVTESADESASDSVESVQSTQAMAPTAEAAAAEEPATTVPPVCQLPYTVGAGDYWIRIADAAGVALGKLLRANVATVATPIYPGDDICLPEGATIPVPPTPTTVAPSTSPPSTSPPSTVSTKPATTTTTAPTTTVPIPPPPPRDEIEAMIREIWPDDLEDKALAIAWRESGYRSTAKNWCCYGIFQIHWSAHKSWLDDFGVTSPAHLLDARNNIKAAYALYQRSGGWGPWGG